MSDWENIVAAAILGTERQTLPSFPANDALASVIARVCADAERTGEQRFLSVAALVSLHQAAGRLPPKASPPLGAFLAQEGDEGWRECNVKAAEQLFAIMQGGKAQYTLLTQWLEAAMDNKKFVPPNLIPKILDSAVQLPNFRERLLQVVGPRGRYLAGLNPEWTKLLTGKLNLPANPEEVWQTGKLSERLTLIYELRIVNPAQARTMLELTWAQEGYKEREVYVGSFKFGLSQDDEPFLEEKALADGRKDVRTAALLLLAKLPESRYAKRLIDLATPLIMLDSDRMNFEVLLPQECDKQMQRDGIELKPYDASFSLNGIGEKQGWVCQLLALIRPSYWCEHFGATAAELLAIAHETKDWRALLLVGWTRATKLHADADWAEALVNMGGKWSGDYEYGELLNCMTRERREGVMLRIIENHGSISLPGNAEVQMLECLPAPWSDRLSAEILKCIKTDLVSQSRTSESKEQEWTNRQRARHIEPVLRLLGEKGDVSIFSELDGKWDYKAPAFRDINESLAHAIGWMRGRKEIVEALRSG